jgi:hypothetical protein
MAWNGYIAVGTVNTSGVFTESSATGYARQKFSFTDQNAQGNTQGYGPPITFTATSAVVSTYNCFGFYTASSGGSPVMLYPTPRPFAFGAGLPLTISPYTFVIRPTTATSGDNLPVNPGSVSVIMGNALPVASATDSITAHAGGGQGSAVPLTTSLNRITTVGTAGDSVVLPASAAGLQVTVINAAAANSLNVFPASGDAINALAANASYSLAAGKCATFFCPVAGNWYGNLSA